MISNLNAFLFLIGTVILYFFFDFLFSAIPQFTIYDCIGFFPLFLIELFSFFLIGIFWYGSDFWTIITVIIKKKSLVCLNFRKIAKTQNSKFTKILLGFMPSDDIKPSLFANQFFLYRNRFNSFLFFFLCRKFLAKRYG